ncbi:MAG: hydrogenase expression/formation protein HypE [Bacteroidota bacterium]|nr:hydrogenase expression/formation protein HypE [Bacteroidota bacterium]
MELQCPMPKLDFDIITLGHGSGGTLTNQLLSSGVFNVLSNLYLDEKHDGAIFPMNGKMAFSSDSFVISPIFFPGGNIGELAVNGTVNDLAMCGAIPQFLSLSFIIEEGLTMTEFWNILNSIKNACDKAGVQVVTGDTKVVEKGKGDKIFINTSGVGSLHEKANISFRNIKAGDKIILSNKIATHGIAIMSIREGLDFETDIVSDTTNLNFTIKKLLDEYGENIHLFRDPTRGGVATVLNEIARDTNFGMEIHQKNIAVDEQVYGACELLGLDPLYVANEGVFIAIIDADIADDLLQTLKQDENGAEATCIGEVTKDHPRQVILNSNIGGRRVVNMLVGEQLPRIC